MNREVCCNDDPFRYFAYGREGLPVSGSVNFRTILLNCGAQPSMVLPGGPQRMTWGKEQGRQSRQSREKSRMNVLITLGAVTLE